MFKDLTYHLSYAISKQLPTAYALNSSYKEIELDEEQESELDFADLYVDSAGDYDSVPLSSEEITTDLSLEPEDYVFDKCNLAGQQKVIFCKSCGKQLSPFQVETYLITRADDPDRGLCSDCSCPDPRKKYGSSIIEKNINAFKNV